MPLHRIEDIEPNYQQTLGENDIKGLDVYTDGTDQRIGTVNDILVDDEGHIRYMIVDLGFWIFGKKVLLPVGRSRIDYSNRRVYLVGLTREQAEHLPEYKERVMPDYDYEEQVRNIYRSPSVDTGASGTYDRSSYNYQQEPSLYNMNDRDHQTLRLYEERLIAHKTRIKAGEVVVGKRVETETATASVPLETERVVIERVTPTDAGRVVSPDEVSFAEGEVARMEVYKETPDIHKEAFVREEVNVKKVVSRDTVEASENLRKEKLDLRTDGDLIQSDETPSENI